MNRAVKPRVRERARSSTGFPALLALLGAVLLEACVSGGSGSEYTNGTLVTGYIIEEDGAPVSNARIWIKPTTYLQDTAEADLPAEMEVARTDAKGYFSIEAVPFGVYTLEARDARLRGMAVQVAATERVTGVGRQAVRPLGSLTGRLTDSAGKAASGFVQVYGLARVARADSAGFFAIGELPSGIHRIRAVSPAPELGFRQPGQVAILPGRTTRLDSLDAVGFGEEDYSQWPHSRRIHVSPAEAGVAETVTDFPLLIRLRNADIDFDASDGKDLRFAGADGKALPFEIERWEPGGRLAEAWVKLDTVPVDPAGFDLTVYWGKRDAPDLSDGKRVFASFAGVWHMQEAQWAKGEATFRDASPTLAAAQGLLQEGTRKAVWGYSGLFQGSHYLHAPGKDALRPAGALAFSAWVLPTAVDKDGGEVASLGDNYLLRVAPGGAAHFSVFDDPDWDGTTGPATRQWKKCQSAGVNLLDKQWHHVAGTFDGSELRLFVDGVLRASLAHQGILAYPLGRDFWIGRNGDGDGDHDFSGQIDEVQVSGRFRSAAWLKLAYENQKPGSTLLQFP